MDALLEKAVQGIDRVLAGGIDALPFTIFQAAFRGHTDNYAVGLLYHDLRRYLCTWKHTL